MPGDKYTAEEIFLIRAAKGVRTAADLAAELGRPENGVYQMARDLGVSLKHKSYGSLDLPHRGAFVIPADQHEHYQECVRRIGEAFNLRSKSQVFLKALELAVRWLDDEEKRDDTLQFNQ